MLDTALNVSNAINYNDEYLRSLQSSKRQRAIVQ